MRHVVLGLLALAGCAGAPPPRFVHFEAGTTHTRSDDDAVQVGMAVTTLQEEPRFRAALIGYASSEGTAAENKKLSFVRAEHVRDMLVRNGVAASRLVIAARGSDNPAGPNDTEEGRAKNRRVEIFFYNPSSGELQTQYGVRIEIQPR